MLTFHTEQPKYQHLKKKKFISVNCILKMQFLRQITEWLVMVVDSAEQAEGVRMQQQDSPPLIIMLLLPNLFSFLVSHKCLFL